MDIFFKNAVANNNGLIPPYTILKEGAAQTISNNMIYSYSFNGVLNGVYYTKDLVNVYQLARSKKTEIKWEDSDNKTVAKIGKTKINLEKVNTTYNVDLSDLTDAKVLDIKDFTIIANNLLSFTNNNSNQQYTRGIIFNNKNMYATNNLAICIYENAFNLDKTFLLPTYFINEILRNKANFKHFLINDEKIQAIFDNNNIIEYKLPTISKYPTFDNLLSKLGDVETIETNNLIEELKEIKLFCDDKVFINKDGICSAPTKDKGAIIEKDYNIDNKCYNIDYLIKILELCSNIKIGEKIFYGENEKENIKAFLMGIVVNE